MSVAGGKMKVTRTATWQSPNTGATNTSGWAGLPGGNRVTSGSFYSIGSSGLWWSSTQDGASNAWNRDLHYSGAYAFRNNDGKASGFSVRCVRD